MIIDTTTIDLQEVKRIVTDLYPDAIFGGLEGAIPPEL